MRLTHLVFCAFLGACALPDPTVQTTSASVADFEQYRTFSVQIAHAAPGGFDVSPRTQDVQHRTLTLASSALAAKGYVNVPDKGDLVVVIAAGEAERTQTRQLTRRAAQVAGDSEETIVVPEGALVIDVYDAKKHERVWRSEATGEIRGQGVDQDRLAQVIGKMMNAFPARR